MRDPQITWHVLEEPKEVKINTGDAIRTLTKLKTISSNINENVVSTLEELKTKTGIMNTSIDSIISNAEKDLTSLTDAQYVPYNEYYAGSFFPNDVLEMTIQVWNNKWGQEAVANVTNGNIAIFFDTEEDNSLLKYCSVKIDNRDFQPINIQSGNTRVELGRTLSGASNEGSLINSKENYATITLRFGPITEGIKNGLKNLYIDFEFQK